MNQKPALQRIFELARTGDHSGLQGRFAEPNGTSVSPPCSGSTPPSAVSLMSLLSLARFVAMLLSLALLGAAGYLLWSWHDGDLVRDMGGYLYRVREDPVPEPSMWTMMLAGFAALDAALRYSRGCRLRAISVVIPD